MNITINGDIYITNYGQTLDEIARNNEDLDLPFDYDDKDNDYCTCCIDDCEDCELYEDEDEEEVDIDELVDDLTSIYADILCGEICCPECTKNILINLIRDLVNLL